MNFSRNIKTILTLTLIITLISSAILPASKVYANTKTTTSVYDQGITYSITQEKKGANYSFTITSDTDNNTKTILVHNNSIIIRNSDDKKTNDILISNLSNIKEEYGLNSSSDSIDRSYNILSTSDWQKNVYEEWKENFYYCYGYNGSITKVIIGGNGNSTVRTMNNLSSTGRGYINYHIEQINLCNYYLKNAILYGSASDIAAIIAYIVAIIFTGGLAVPIAVSIIATLTGGNT